MNFPNSDRVIDMLILTAAAVAVKALVPIPINLLELMGLTGLVGMWLLGQIRATVNSYPYEVAEIVPVVHVYP